MLVDATEGDPWGTRDIPHILNGGGRNIKMTCSPLVNDNVERLTYATISCVFRGKPI